MFPSEADTSNGFAISAKPSFTAVKTLQVLELLAQQQVQKLIIAMPQTNGAEVRKLIAECRKASIQVYLVPQLYDLYLSKVDLVEIDGLPLLSLQERNPSAGSFALKRTMDFVLSSGILLLVSPILAIAALFVYSRKGKAFRTELRCGKDGIPFPMYRLNLERHATSPERYEKTLRPLESDGTAATVERIERRHVSRRTSTRIARESQILFGVAAATTEGPSRRHGPRASTWA